jgi:Phage integrase family
MGTLNSLLQAVQTPTAGVVESHLVTRRLDLRIPSPSSDGHFNGDAAKDQHARALTDSGVLRFVPYILRHTALTNLAKKGADAHTLARIAGHSSIVMTMRYVHPQADAIERAFAMAHGKVSGSTHRLGVGTKLVTITKAQKAMPRKLLVRKGGVEPPWVAPPDPKSGASASSATFARLNSTFYVIPLFAAGWM